MPEDGGLAALVAGEIGAMVDTASGPVRVRPPTVREALACEALLAPAASGASLDLAALRRLVFGWLPMRLASTVCARRLPWPRRAQLLRDLLTVGVPEVDTAKREKARAAARRRTWPSLLAEYRAAYRVEPLGEPWPRFLRRFERLDEVRARFQIDQAGWYAAARTGELERITRRLDGYAEAEDAFEWPDHLDEEWQERQLEIARKVGRTMRA